MSKSCECCKRYWTHLHGKVKCFVGKMNSNSRHVMVIPESFVNYFARKISGTIKLEAPDGSVYDVGITEHKNKTLLRSGWEVFVDANHIVENDLLMFQYRGNSRFKVIVFDSSGCEKVVSCAHIESNISDQEPSTNTHSTDMSSSSSDRNTQSSARGRSDGGQSGSSGHFRKRARKDAISSPSKDLSDDSPCEHESSESDDDTLSKPFVLSGQCYLTKEQDAEIVALVQEIQPERPPLVAMMKPNVKPYPDLVIPKDYALAYFPHKNQTITLQIPGQTKKWHCQFRVRSDGGRCNLFGCDFAGDNHLLEGDLCLFQPTTRANGRTFIVTVHLLRKASNDQTSSGNLVIGSNRGLANSKLASTMRVKEEPDVGEATLYSEHGFSENSLEHDGSESSKLPYMMPMRARLTKSQEKKVLEKVGTTRSEMPIYVAVMKKTNLTGQSFASSLTFGKQYSATYLQKRSRNLVLKRNGKSQTWHAEMHDKDGGGLRIFGGWASFAGDNRLREGDLCLFQLMKHKEQLTMIVDIILREHC